MVEFLMVFRHVGFFLEYIREGEATPLGKRKEVSKQRLDRVREFEGAVLSCCRVDHVNPACRSLLVTDGDTRQQ